MIFLDSLENRIAPLIVLSWERTVEINKVSKLIVKATKGLEKHDRIIHDSKEYIATGVEEVHGKHSTVEIYAEESIVELGGKIIKDSRPNTLLAALLAITSDTRWSIGQYPSVEGKRLSFYRISALEALEKVVEAYGLEIETEYTFSGRDITRTLHLRSRIGESRGRRTTLNTDALEIKRTIQDDPVITKLYGYGKGEELEGGSYGRRIDVASVNGNLDYIEDNAARVAYGVGKDRLHYEGVLVYEDIEDPQELLDAMTAAFEILKTPKITYEGKIADLGLYDDHLGDDITILDEGLGVAVKGRILKLVTTPKEKRATVGNLLPSIGSDLARIKSLEQRIKDYDILRNALVNLDSRDYLDGVIDRINTELNAVSGYASLIPGRGIIIPNDPTESEATQVIELGGGYLRIANTKDQFGNWEYRTIADGRGVIATEIVAGILKGGQVVFNLEAGTFLIGNPTDPSLYWDGSDLFIKGDTIDISGNESITTRVTASEMASAISDATFNLASTAYVDGAIDAINRANPNLVSNRSDKWAQGNLVSGAQVASTKHIHTQSFYPIRAGSATIKVSPLYEAAIAIFDSSYTHLSATPFSAEQTVSIPANSFFRAILRRVGGTEDIIPSAIDTAELKVENAAEATQWTPYFGDMTLEEQKEFFQLHLTSSNGWAVDNPTFTTTLNAHLYLFNEDVSQTYPGAQIFWYRQYPGAEKALIGSGLTYNVTAAETEKSATYEVVFFIPANKYYLMTKSGDRLLTKGGDYLLAKVANDPGISVSVSKVLVRDYRDRIIVAESSVTQLADSIEQKVEVSTYNAEKNVIETNITTLTTRATNVEAAINGATHTFTATGYVFKDANGNVVMDNSLGMANEQNLMKHDDCESGFPLVMPIHIGSSTSSIYQVLVKWKNSPFRATAKSASAGGATTSGASSAETSASGGGGTSGSSSRSTSDSWYQYSANTSWNRSANDPGDPSAHYHLIPANALSHSHGMNHTHSISAHTHGMAHTHGISAHTHDLIFGVVETPVTSNALTVWIDGVQRGSVNAAQGELDVTSFLQTTGWHTIELRTTTLKRIDGNVFVKSYIRR